MPTRLMVDISFSPSLGNRTQGNYLISHAQPLPECETVCRMQNVGSSRDGVTLFVQLGRWRLMEIMTLISSVMMMPVTV